MLVGRERERGEMEKIDRKETPREKNTGNEGVLNRDENTRSSVLVLFIQTQPSP